MPPRRGNRCRAKRKRAITTRLIEISLILDDYVYKNKPISVADAQAYINEISIYNTQCLQDERSLQVIEKLTRCMKAIVDKEQINDSCENQQDIGTKTTVCSFPSPTYSIVEDMELLARNEQSQETQDMIQPNAAGAPSEKVAKHTIDLCAAKENKRDHRVFNIDVEMHRSISNLSIRDQDPFNNTTDIYSQSILENVVQGIEDSNSQVSTIHPTHSITACTAILTNKDSSIPNPIKTKWYNNNKSTQNNLEVIDLTEDESLSKNKKASVKKVVRINKEAKDNAFAKDHMRNVSKNYNQKRNISLKCKLNKQNNTEIKKRSKRPANKQIKTKKQKTITTENILCAKMPNIKAKSNGTNPNSIVSTKTDLSFGANNTLSATNTCHTISISSNVKRATKHFITKIYSNHTENDLSWVENIRFVREIQKEEIDKELSSLNDSFWEDLSFPSDWDEREFNI